MADRKSIDWGRVERLHPMLFPLYLGEGEAAVIQVLKNLILQAGQLEKTLNLPRIVWFEFEYPLPRGRADLVLFHHDGSITVVEAKQRLGLRDLLTGVGQLMSYSVQIGFSKTSHTIRKILVAPMAATEPEALIALKACEEAGVRFVPMGDIRDHQESNNKILLSMRPDLGMEA